MSPHSSSSSSSSVTRSASDLADDFEDLHFFPPTRSSPPSMKNFISSASNTSLSHSSSGSSGLGNEDFESNDFTLGSRLNIVGRRRGEFINREEATHPSSSTNHNHNSSNINSFSSRRASQPSITRHQNSKERYVFSKYAV